MKMLTKIFQTKSIPVRMDKTVKIIFATFHLFILEMTAKMTNTTSKENGPKTICQSE